MRVELALDDKILDPEVLQPSPASILAGGCRNKSVHTNP